MFKCSYCGTNISLLDLIAYFGKCVYCDIKLNGNPKEDSEKYWRENGKENK